jgi:hypothetical protein
LYDLYFIVEKKIYDYFEIIIFAMYRPMLEEQFRIYLAFAEYAIGPTPHPSPKSKVGYTPLLQPKPHTHERDGV